MCLYIVDNVSTCRIIYFQYVDTEKRIDNSPTHNIHKNVSKDCNIVCCMSKLACCASLTG